MRMKLADFVVVDHADVDDADPTQTYYCHSKTFLRFNLDSMSTSGLDAKTYAEHARAAHQYARLSLLAEAKGMSVRVYKGSKAAAKVVKKTSLEKRVAAQIEAENIRQHEQVEQTEQAQQKKLDEQDRQIEQTAVALGVARSKIRGRHQRQKVKLKAAAKSEAAKAELAKFGATAMHELYQETAEGSEHEDEEASGGEEDSSSEHSDELSDASPATPLVRPALKAAGNSPSIGVPITQSISTIEALYPYASVGVEPFPPVVLHASPVARVVPARARSLVEATSPALRASPAISSEPARSSSSPASMVIAEQPLVSSLKAHNAELEANVVEEQTKSAQKSVWLKQTMTKLTEAKMQLCEEKQLRAVAEEKVEAITQLKNEAEARLYESESRANASEETIKDMQQNIDKLVGENKDLNYLKTYYQKTFSDAENADQAKQRVQDHAPPQAPTSTKGGEAKQGPPPSPKGGEAKQGPTPRR